MKRVAFQGHSRGHSHGQDAIGMRKGIERVHGVDSPQHLVDLYNGSSPSTHRDNLESGLLPKLSTH